MAAKILIAFLLAFTCERVLCQEREPLQHTIIWDRFWLNRSLTNNTLEVKLNDAVMFQCHVNSTEPDEDKIENIVLLEEEAHLAECDIGGGQSRHLATCRNSLIDHVILITESQDLVNRPSFSANQTYYFTSFSDGTENSANTDISRGGACDASPPLRLTITVLPTTTSSTVPAPTTTAIISTTTSNIISTTTSSSVTTSTSSSSALTAEPTSPTTERITGPPVTLPPPEGLSGVELSAPVLSVILLLSLLITCVNML